MTQVVILAAGQGTRMKSKIPKVLQKVGGRPIILRLIESVKKSGVSKKPLVVVAKDSNLIREALGDSCFFAVQAEQLGTGHAVMSAKEQLKEYDDVLVLYGDHPFLKPETIERLNDLHKKEDAVLSMMTIKLDDFSGWKNVFYDFGRILRNEKGEIIGIKEKKDATPEELEIKEVNPAFFCFSSDWLWQNINKLRNDNKQEEYYLTDLVGLAVEQCHKIASLNVLAEESLGLNTKEHLKIAEDLF